MAISKESLENACDAETHARACVASRSPAPHEGLARLQPFVATRDKSANMNMKKNSSARKNDWWTEPDDEEDAPEWTIGR